MLSRTADNLYWLSRYIERAEYLARILDATQRLSALPLAYVGTSNEWESAVATAGCAHAFAAAYPEANEEAVTDFLCFSTANPSSIRSCFEIARTNARAVRTARALPRASSKQERIDDEFAVEKARKSVTLASFASS